MTLEKVRQGTGFLMAVVSLGYIIFSGVAVFYAYYKCPPSGDGVLSLAAVQMASVIMVIAALCFGAYTVLWIIESHKGWKGKNVRYFGWLCALAVVMFFVPSSVTGNTANLFTGSFAPLSFVPVLLPVVMMLSAAVLMFEIIKEKNGGRLRRIKK